MQSYGKVSIITPSYNCGRFLEETIKSVIGQTYSDWELLFQDDCSTDNTRSLVEYISDKDSRIKYVCNPKNSGAAITRNNALKRATGRWIAFLDSDDLWKPDKLEKQLKFMVENGYHFSYHEYVEIDEDSKEIGVYVSGIRKVGKYGMYSCCWPGCLSVMYDAEVVGLIQIVDVRKNNDTAMWLKVVEKAKCHLLKENLGFYRRRKGSITPPSIKDRIKWHYILFRSIGKGCITSIFWMCMNIFGNLIKKLFFIKKYNAACNNIK